MNSESRVIITQHYWSIVKASHYCTMEAVPTAEEEVKKKLPYFHRNLSPQELALIGDTSPKPITAVSTTENTAESQNTASQWNAADSWEEKDVSQIVKELLKTAFEEPFELEDGNSTDYRVELHSLEIVQGSASITHVRGKKRFFYDFTLSLSFSLIHAPSSSSYAGKITCEDVVNDQLDDMEMSFTWTGTKRPPNDQHAIVKGLLVGKRMKTLLTTKIMTFQEQYQKM